MTTRTIAAVMFGLSALFANTVHCQEKTISVEGHVIHRMALSADGQLLVSGGW